ncbi:hypothetical protein GTP91_09815 [Rugamonas sp. FT82W]|uniref:HNH nuclease domain-containing protein n=1 Tax=Duganella vulcania TaxID=2692166 RepID=A0A845G259_9BURK|nr:HNH endonuclease [Duganella vulcania]MYM87475.1 hypothetical protein [Duganella vulcania]
MASFLQFLVAAKALNGNKLPTVGGRSFFKLGVTAGGFTYTPAASGKLRKQSFEVAKRIFERNLGSGSFKTTDYLDITRNSSYILSLIRNVVQEPTSKERIQNSENTVLEGLAVERRQLLFSRNKKIADDRKERDNYTCQVCGFNATLENRSIVECHHLHPISTGIIRNTAIKDLITLCPTCHRFAHLQHPPLDLSQLRALLGKSKK